MACELDELAGWVSQYRATRFDLYYCANAFAERKRQSRYALQTPFAWCDIDDGPPSKFDPPPNILIETSPNRYQGIWCFEKKAEPTYAEAYSKHLAYSFGGDKNGWSITKMLRLPFSINHKPTYAKPPVRLLRWHRDALLNWPSVRAYSLQAERTLDLRPSGNADVVVARYSKCIASKCLSLMKHRRMLSSDRSRCIFMIVAALYRAGADLNEIATVLHSSPYFLSKHGEDQHALEEEIDRITAKLDRETDAC